MAAIIWDNMNFSFDCVLVAFGPRWELWWPKLAWQALTPEEQTAVVTRQRDLLANTHGPQQENLTHETYSRSYYFGR